MFSEEAFSADEPFDHNKDQDSGRLQCSGCRFSQLFWMQYFCKLRIKLLIYIPKKPYPNNGLKIIIGAFCNTSLVIPFFFWSPLLMLIFNIDDIFNGCLCINPQFIISSIRHCFNASNPAISFLNISSVPCVPLVNIVFSLINFVLS